MGDDNWKSYRSKEDQTQSISQSIFLTNFPDHVTACDLWKVDNIDRLVMNLCTIWIGRFHFYANVARFHREHKPSATSHPLMLMRGIHQDRDVSLSLMGKVKDITAMPNLYVILEKEGVGSWFSSLKPACNSFISDEGVVQCIGFVQRKWKPGIHLFVMSNESESSDNEEDAKDDRKDSGDDLKYLPGFTPSVINVEEVNKKVKGATSNEVLERKKKGLGFWQEKLVLNLLALIESKEHGKQLLDSVKNGPFHFGTIPVPGTATTLIAIRDITMDDLTPKEKIFLLRSCGQLNRRLRSDTVAGVLTPSLDHPNGVVKNPDAISTFFTTAMKSLLSRTVNYFVSTNVVNRSIEVDTPAQIMPPRMRTRSTGRPASESLGGGTGVRVGRGGRGKRPREGNDERVDD
ncbi:hypothetical protein Tco_1377167 [Tanacetum coccineum]